MEINSKKNINVLNSLPLCDRLYVIESVLFSIHNENQQNFDDVIEEVLIKKLYNLRVRINRSI